ncbi:hypothetical protein ACFL1E_07915 [Candidatus Omnitrophota bacterium]
MYCKRDKHIVGQGMIEWIVLISVIVSALLLMSAFLKRAYSGRLKQDAESLGGELYAPKHTTSVIETVTTSETATSPALVGGLGGIIIDGVTITTTDSSSTFSRREAVDPFAH